MKKILLTGSDGFIGRNFVKYYGDGYRITNFGGVLPHFDVDLDPYDLVVHLGALAGVRASHEFPNDYWRVNVIGSQMVIKACHNTDTPLIYASSSSIYEWWLSPYATTKKVVETLAYNKRALGLRFHTVYGPNSRPDMLYDKLQKKNVEYLTDHTRDWTHVHDVADAINVCIENFDEIWKHTAIDVGTGRPCKVTEMAQKVWPDNDLPVRIVEGERRHTKAYTGHLEEYGWKAKHHILED